MPNIGILYNLLMKDPDRPGCLKPIAVSLSLLVLTAFPIRSWATLGEDEASVRAEQQHVKGALKTTTTRSYTVHEIDATSGTVLKEYISPQGKVFAVIWQGPLLPDFRKLLGSYFAHYSGAAWERSSMRPRIRGPLRIQTPELVMYSGGHMRSFFGWAYSPGLMPEGLTIGDLQ